MAELVAIAVIKQVHVVVQIGEERGRLQTIAPRSDVSACVSSVIKSKLSITLVVLPSPLIAVAAWTQKR